MLLLGLRAVAVPRVSSFVGMVVMVPVTAVVAAVVAAVVSIGRWRLAGSGAFSALALAFGLP